VLTTLGSGQPQALGGGLLTAAVLPTEGLLFFA